MIVNRHLTAPTLVCLCGYFLLASTYTGISLPTCFLPTASLQRERDRLRSLLQSIKFPPIESFTVDGVTYGLPLKAIPPPKQKPTREELEYLCGFFDGDGCVTMPRGIFRLTVVQSINNAHILLRFRRAFGGGVYANRQRTGFSQATLVWQVTGKSASLAAGLMATVPSMKQSQLEVAASGTVEAAHRSKVKAKLKTMKQKNYIPTSLAVTWPYFAGFFDAEGCILVRPAHSGSVALAIAQVNPTVLESLLVFLQDQGLDRWKLWHYSKASQMKCQHHRTSKLTLKRLLQNGLSVKKQQAKIALELTPANRPKIRDELCLLAGRQERYVRLDEAGCLRAKEINNFQGRLRRNKCKEKRKQLEVELMRLQEEHAFARLVSECQTLESDIDMMLADGGRLAQSCEKAWSEKELDVGTKRGVWWIGERSPLALAKKNCNIPKQKEVQIHQCFSQPKKGSSTKKKLPSSILVDFFLAVENGGLPTPSSNWCERKGAIRR